MGRIDGALDFDHDGDAVRIPASPSLNDIDTLSVSLWFKADSLGETERGRLIDKEDSFKINFSHQEAMIYFTAERWDDDKGKWRWRTNDEEDLLDAWHHLVILYDYSDTDNDPVAYLDGELLTDMDELAEPDGDPESNTNDLHLGNGMALDRSYDGLLDDVRVYDECCPNWKFSRWLALPKPSNFSPYGGYPVW